MVWLLGTPLGCSSGIDTYFGKPWMDTVYNGEIRKKKCGDLSKFADPLDINIYIYPH
jgi:predicted outer membrane lipoprotein